MKSGPRLKKTVFSLTRKDEVMEELVRQNDKKTLGVWTIDCTLRVLPYFEKKYPADSRHRHALETLRV